VLSRLHRILIQMFSVHVIHHQFITVNQNVEIMTFLIEGNYHERFIVNDPLVLRIGGVVSYCEARRPSHSWHLLKDLE